MIGVLSKFPLVTVTVLRTVLTGLSGIGDQFKEVANAASALPKKIKPQWGKHIPQLAMAFANMIETQPALFAWFLYTADDLRNLNQTVEVLREIKGFLDSLSTQVGDLLGTYRDQLFTIVTEGAADLQKIIDCPTTDDAVRQQIIKLSQSVTSIIDDRNATINQTKKQNKQNTRAHQGQVALLNQENAVLRGGDLPAPPKTKRSRKTKRG